MRITSIVTEFADLVDWEHRYKHIIDLGKHLAPLHENHKVDSHKVKGCQSQVWLYGELVEGKVIFTADSDAAIVKGIIALLLRVYSQLSPDEILETRADFLQTIGLKQHLSMSRANGLNAMVKQIFMYALAFKTKIQLGQTS